MKNLLSSISFLGSYAAVGALTVGGMVGFTYTAHAADGKACYQQFSEAKKAGTLVEKNFKAYKVAHCGKDAKQNEKSVVNEPKKEEKSASDRSKEPANIASKKEAAGKAPVTTGDVVFPDKIDSKFASEKEGKARMKTCQEQYNANKVSNKNGGLKWIQKGGGYYSECNKHLKTSAK